MRRWFVIAGAVAVVVVIAIGITQSSGGDSENSGSVLTPAQASAKLAGSPPRLAAIHAQSNQILGGGQPAYRKRIKALRGLPIVVNGWAAWCTACRTEMPIFNRVSAQLGRRVAFLGIDVEDSRENAKVFLKQIPVSYPSYEDGDSKIVDQFGLVALPSTVFYDRSGRKYLHQGAYRSEADLLNDIRRYAFGG